MNKYGNKRTCFDGRSFSSQGEAECYLYLKALEQNKEIQIMQCQDHVYLTNARICYIADFKIYNLKTLETEWIEFKGFETDVWKIKKRLWDYYGPGKLRIYKKIRKNMVLIETLTGCDS